MIGTCKSAVETSPSADPKKIPLTVWLKKPSLGKPLPAI
jgi:hypothetical protein